LQQIWWICKVVSAGSNPNIEYRNPKQIQNPNSPMSQTKASEEISDCPVLVILILLIRICFVLRASDFEFDKIDLKPTM